MRDLYPVSDDGTVGQAKCQLTRGTTLLPNSREASNTMGPPRPDCPNECVEGWGGFSLQSQAADLLLGNMDMERTLETHGAKDVTRCLDGARIQHGVLPSHRCAFQPALRDLTSDRGGAR